MGYGKSVYKKYGHIDKTVNWSVGDTEDMFELNMADPEKRAQLEEYGWTRDNVSYTFNKDGFRSEEFTYEPNDSVLFLGCSFTMGLGVDLESSWAYKVATTLGLRRYNLGIAGGSTDTCFRLAHHWIPLLKPKYVVMMIPMGGRMEILVDGHIIQCLPNMNYRDMHIMIRIGGFYECWLSDTANVELNQLKNVIGIQMICNRNDVPLLEMPALRCLTGGKHRKLPLARDLVHPGREWHQYVADTFIEKIGA